MFEHLYEHYLTLALRQPGADVLFDSRRMELTLMILDQVEAASGEGL